MSGVAERRNFVGNLVRLIALFVDITPEIVDIRFGIVNIKRVFVDIRSKNVDKYDIRLKTSFQHVLVSITILSHLQHLPQRSKYPVN